MPTGHGLVPNAYPLLYRAHARTREASTSAEGTHPPRGGGASWDLVPVRLGSSWSPVVGLRTRARVRTGTRTPTTPVG
jgi:hypothetical protein